MVDGGGPSGSVVRVGLSARRLEAAFTPPYSNRNKTNKLLLSLKPSDRFRNKTNKLLLSLKLSDRFRNKINHSARKSSLPYIKLH